MKKLLLLIMIAIPLSLTLKSCHSDDVPVKNYINLHLDNSYLDSYPDVSNLNISITVWEYDSTGQIEGVFDSYSGQINDLDQNFTLEIPYHSRITVTITSIDCSNYCNGSCPVVSPYTQAGKPVFSYLFEYLDTTDYTNTFNITPYVSDCL